MNTLFLSTATTTCTLAVKARLLRASEPVVLRLTGDECAIELAHLARKADRVIAVTGKGMRASQHFLAAARAATRAGRACLFIQHADGLADQLRLPPGCAKRYYRSASEAADAVAEFGALESIQPLGIPGKRLRVFALDDGPDRWNETIKTLLNQPGVERIHCADLSPRSVVRAAMQADATIVVPCGRKHGRCRREHRLMQLAIGTSDMLRKKSLVVHNFRISQSTREARMEWQNCRTVVCVTHTDVEDAVNEFLDDATANVALA